MSQWLSGTVDLWPLLNTAGLAAIFFWIIRVVGSGKFVPLNLHEARIADKEKEIEKLTAALAISQEANALNAKNAEVALETNGTMLHVLEELKGLAQEVRDSEAS